MAETLQECLDKHGVAHRMSDHQLHFIRQYLREEYERCGRNRSDCEKLLDHHSAQWYSGHLEMLRRMDSYLVTGAFDD